MTRYIYKKMHIDKGDPTDTVSIPDDAIHVDVKYGVHDIPGHMTVQWLEPVMSTSARVKRNRKQTSDYTSVGSSGLEAAMLDSYSHGVNMTPLRVMIAIMLVLAALIVSFALYRSMQ